MCIYFYVLEFSKLKNFKFNDRFLLTFYTKFLSKGKFYDYMTLKLFNTLGRKKEDFIPIDKNGKIVKMYSCGPTVYYYSHIGNLRAFIFADLLKRYLKFKGYDVLHVMNITDVDDKTIRDSIKNNQSLSEFTEFYTEKFIDDLKKLNIEIADIMPKATEHISEMVNIIKKLKEKGLTYESKGSIYFKISKSKKYGELACLNIDDLKNNADNRINDADEYEKEDARDFALWKAYDESDGNVFWETEIGKGRPGWHIECSAMSTKYLGDTFDIHTGGVDLIFPHHTNEIAQTEEATGKKWVNYWIHNAHLIVNGEKMSKSLGNFFVLKDLLDKGYDTRAIRFELLKSHYRSQLDFREDELKKIPELLNKFDEAINKLNNIIEKNENSNDQKINSIEIKDSFLKNFENIMDDDLNISGGLAVVFDFIKEINKQIDNKLIGSEDAKNYIECLKKIDSVLGIMKFESEKISEDIIQLAEQRLIARKEKNWQESDRIRDEIKAKGYEVLDSKDSYRLKKID